PAEPGAPRTRPPPWVPETTNLSDLPREGSGPPYLEPAPTDRCGPTSSKRNHMNVVRRSATGALAAFALVIAGPALSAHAAHQPYHFQTLSSVAGAKVQGCRIPTSASQPVTIKLRVNATKATGRVNGQGWVTRNGTRV